MSQREEESRGHVDWSLLQWSHSTWEVMSNGALIKWPHSTCRGEGGLSPPARSNGKSNGKTPLRSRMGIAESQATKWFTGPGLLSDECVTVCHGEDGDGHI